ncbi:MAG: sugar ABC transporter substrate-binding protein [bacterium]|nr:sugar ABC transporter substrate-binding protein [bacterium]
MKSRRISIWLILAIVCALYLQGCGGKREDASVLRWSCYSSPGYNEFREDQSKMFAASHPGMKVKYEPLAGGFDTKILTQIAGGVAPDVFAVAAVNYHDYARKGIIADLTGMMKKDEALFKAMYPSVMENMNYKGRYYGVPINITTYVLYYNRDVFDRMKIPYPTEKMTLEEMIETAKKMTIKRSDGKTEQYGLAGFNHVVLLSYLYGGKLLNSDGTWNVKSDAMRSAFKFIRDTTEVIRVSSKLQQNAGDSGNGMGPVEQFVMGKTAMLLGGTWQVAGFDLKRAGSELNYGVVPVPVPADGRRVYPAEGLILAVNAKSRNVKAAYEFVKFLASPEQTKFVVEKGDSLPMRPEGADMEAFNDCSIYSPEVRKGLMAAVKYSFPMVKEYEGCAGIVPAQFKETLERELEAYVILGEDLSKVLSRIDAAVNRKDRRY